MTTIADPRRVLDPPGIQNPYWEEVKVLPDSRLSFDGTWMPDGIGFNFATLQPSGDPTREELVHQYAWAITDPASVAFVAEHAPGGIVEIGAGTGYWAWQLTQRGVGVAPYDIAPPDLDPNHYCQESTPDRKPSGKLRPVFYPVLRGGPEAAARHPDRALFLCWPPYQSPMAAEALAAYPGDTVILIGEPDGGCTADEGFFTALGKGWEEVAEHAPVQFGGIHDYITVHRRRAEAKEPA